nr:MAG TPA: hypothetical protein [Caudoviricetes sp.]
MENFACHDGYVCTHDEFKLHHVDPFSSYIYAK